MLGTGYYLCREARGGRGGKKKGGQRREKEGGSRLFQISEGGGVKLFIKKLKGVRSLR